MITIENLREKKLQVLQALAAHGLAGFVSLADRTGLPVSECAYLAGLLVGGGEAVGVFAGHLSNLMGVSVTEKGMQRLAELKREAVQKTRQRGAKNGHSRTV